MYSDAGRSIGLTPSDQRRSLQSLEKTRPWGTYELISSVLFVCLSLISVGAIAALVIQLIGIEALVPLYGINP